MEKQSSSLKQLFLASWVSTATDRVRFLVFIFLFVLANIFELLVPWSIGYTLGVFIERGTSEDAFQRTLYGILAYVGLRLLSSIFHHTARYIQLVVAYTSKMETLTRVFSNLLIFPLNWHVRNHSGESLTKLHRSAGAIENVVATYIWQIVEGVIKVFFASLAILALDTWVALNVLMMAIATVVFMVFFNSHLTSAYRDNNNFNNKISRICVDYLYNMVTVKTLNLEPQAERYLRSQVDEGRKYAKKISLFNELKWGSTSIGYGLVIGSSLLIYFYSRRSASVPFEVASVYVLLNYLDRIFGAISSFTGYYSGIIEASIAFEDAKNIESDAKAIRAVREKLPPSRSINFESIKLKDIDFSYASRESIGLKRLSFEFSRGDKIALVGPSGGGKSTLMKVISSIIVPHGGELLIDGEVRPFSDFEGSALLIPQEPEIFSESLRYNLTVGEKYSNSEISEVITACRLDSVIAKLPNGLDTDMAENGLNLSVGEKQRVALARGLLRAKEKSLILLDEPTSSLDPLTEKEIFSNLLTDYSDRTIITACHRLNLVPLFNKVAFVTNGNIEEVGSFEELLYLGRRFSEAWKDFEKKVNKAAV